MDTNNSRMSELGLKLTGLAEMLGPGAALSTSNQGPSGRSRCAAESSRYQAPPTPASCSLAASMLRSNNFARDAPLGGLLAKYRDAEASWLKVSSTQAHRVPCVHRRSILRH